MIYELYCKNCENEIEIQCSVNERKQKRTCNVCGNVLYRKMSLNNFHLKNGGWAKNGYTKKEKK